MLYQYGEYPYHCIGPVSFVWKPQLPVETGSSQSVTEGRQVESTDSEGRQLWLWCHPACFDDVWRELLKCYDIADDVRHTVNIVSADSEIDEKTSDTEILMTDKPATELSINTDVSVQSDKDIDWNQFVVVGTIKESVLEKKGKKMFEKGCRLKTPEELGKLKPAICDKFKSEEEVSNGEITVKSLAGSLLRYRLTGPQSNAVLVDALQQSNIVPAKNSGDNMKWWHKYFADTDHSLGHTLQKEFWESVGQSMSPAELSPHCVIGLTVTDPRLTRPGKKTRIYPGDTGTVKTLKIGVPK